MFSPRILTPFNYSLCERSKPMLQSYKLVDIMVMVSGRTENVWRIVSAWVVKGSDLLTFRNMFVVSAHRA